MPINDASSHPVCLNLASSEVNSDMSIEEVAVLIWYVEFELEKVVFNIESINVLFGRIM
jgi:hypothetical protein